MALLAGSTLRAKAYRAAEAAGHIREQATVCGTVAGEHIAYSSRGTATLVHQPGSALPAPGVHDPDLG